MSRVLICSAFISSVFIHSPALTLPEALDIAREHSGELQAARAEKSAADAEVRAAGVWENPELEFEIEGIGGDNHKLDSAEYTLSVSQQIPFPGRMRRQRLVSTHAAGAAAYAADEAAASFEAAVQRAFYETLAQQKRVELCAEQTELSRRFCESVQEQHRRGAAAELDLMQAEIALNESMLEESAAERLLNAGRKNFAKLIGAPAVESLSGDLQSGLNRDLKTVPLENHPSVRRLIAAENQALAEVAVEKSAAFESFTVGAGAKYERADQNQSYLVSFGIPLPLFNRGKSAALAAGFRADAARMQSLIALRDLEMERTAALNEYETAADAAARVEEELLPKVQRAYELVERGHAAGLYRTADLILAQKSLAEMKARAVDARLDAVLAYVELLQFLIKE